MELEEGVDSDFVSPLFESDTEIKYAYKASVIIYNLNIYNNNDDETSYAPIEQRNKFR